MSEILVLPGTVTEVTERKRKQYVSGYGDKAEFKDVSDGWHMTVDHRFTFYVGSSRPMDLSEGDEIDLVVRKRRT